MIALLFLAGTAGGADPEISIAGDREAGFEVTVPDFPLAQEDAVMRRMEGLAAQRCAPLGVQWGALELARTGLGTPEAKVTGFLHRFACVAVDPADPRRAPAGWQPAVTDDADANAVALRYLDVFGSGDADAAFAMMDESFAITRARWLELSADFRQRAGQGTPFARNVRWDLNPEVAPHPGIYARVTLTGSFAELSSFCALVWLYRESPHRYRVVKQQITSSPKGAPPAEQREGMQDCNAR